jgi:hypothetical protein
VGHGEGLNINQKVRGMFNLKKPYFPTGKGHTQRANKTPAFDENLSKRQGLFYVSNSWIKC